MKHLITQTQTLSCVCVSMEEMLLKIKDWALRVWDRGAYLKHDHRGSLQHKQAKGSHTVL